MKVLLIGGSGFLGSMIKRELGLLYDVHSPSAKQLDINRADSIDFWLENLDPDVVVNSAGYVPKRGDANSDILLGCNKSVEAEKCLIDKCVAFSIPSFYSVSSSYLYNYSGPEKIKESEFGACSDSKIDSLYSLSKFDIHSYLIGIRRKYGVNYTTLSVSNVFNFEEYQNGNYRHVVSSCFKKFHDAKISSGMVDCMGNPKDVRDFINAYDAVSAICYLIKKNTGLPLINIGSGKGTSIYNLYEAVSKLFDGLPVRYERGHVNKSEIVLDVSLLKELGWDPLCDMDYELKVFYETSLNVMS